MTKFKVMSILAVLIIMTGFSISNTALSIENGSRPEIAQNQKQIEVEQKPQVQQLEESVESITESTENIPTTATETNEQNETETQSVESTEENPTTPSEESSTDTVDVSQENTNSEQTVEEVTTTESEESTTGEMTETTNPESLSDIENTESDLKLELWTDNEDSQYKIGETVTIYFKSNKDTHLTLINIGTSGKVHKIFPNQYQEDNYIKANTIYALPTEDSEFQFKLLGPKGVDTVKAIATESEVILVSQNEDQKDGVFQEIDKPQSELARDIAVTLAPVNKKKWAEAELEIQVVE